MIFPQKSAASFYTPELLGYTENIFLPMLIKEKELPSSGL
jgi:hypothetical protein